MSTGPTGRSEGGTTLIELIITVAIMGFAMLALMGGIGTSIIFADIQRNDASIGLVLTSSAEKLVGESIPYLTCKGPADYQLALTSSGFVVPDRFTVTVDSVQYWNVQSNMFQVAVPSCAPVPPATATDSGLQLIKLTVTGSSTRRAPEVQTIEIAKRLVTP